MLVEDRTRALVYPPARSAQIGEKIVVVWAGPDVTPLDVAV